VSHSTNGDSTNGKTPTGSGNGSSPGADGAGDGAKPAVVKPPQGEQRNFGPRPMLGMPMEKSEDFKNSSLRLANRLRPEWWRVLLVVVLAVTSVTMTVFGPKILGHATNIIVAGVFGGQGVDFGALHRTLGLAALLYAGSALLAYTQGWILAGTVQRTMYRLRADVDQAWAGTGALYFRRLSARRTASRMSSIIGTPQYQLMTIRNWRTTTTVLGLLDELI